MENNNPDRVIKYRLRDKRENCWYKEKYIDNVLVEEVLYNPIHWFLMLRTVWDHLDATDKVQDRFIMVEYTWLKDKNWVEIYEWDILQDSKWNTYKVVFWEYTCWDMYYSCSSAFVLEWDNMYSNNYIRTEREVIWNIYQNADLLPE